MVAASVDDGPQAPRLSRPRAEKSTGFIASDIALLTALRANLACSALLIFIPTKINIAIAPTVVSILITKSRSFLNWVELSDRL
jgi:hypothetical protein